MLKYGNREIKAVIFDIDGTVIDSLALYHECLNRELEEAGFQPVSKDFLNRNLAAGVSLKDILEKILSANGSSYDLDALVDGILKRFWREDAEVALLPGVEETFCYLKSKTVKIGLATGRTSKEAYEWRKFRNLKVSQYIDAIVTSAELLERKPAPDVIVECARKLGVVSAKSVAVGDTMIDVIAAKEAGAISIGVATGVEKGENLKKAGADAVIERLDLLIDLFENNC